MRWRGGFFHVPSTLKRRPPADELPRAFAAARHERRCGGEPPLRRREFYAMPPDALLPPEGYARRYVAASYFRRCRYFAGAAMAASPRAAMLPLPAAMLLPAAISLRLLRHRAPFSYRLMLSALMHFIFFITRRVTFSRCLRRRLMFALPFDAFLRAISADAISAV